MENLSIEVLELVSVAELRCFHRFCETCEDFDSGGYDVSRDVLKSLAVAGLVRWCGGSRFEVTSFGSKVRESTSLLHM